MKLITQAIDIAKDELALFKRFPRLILAAFAVSLVPALYALIYLSSVWDPNLKTNALPVALVNLDAGITYQGHAINVGAEVAKNLKNKGTFGFQESQDADAAAQAVRSGALSFAIIIPKDFSQQAVPGALAGGGKIRVILSEGNNYSAAGLAKRFAVELGHQVNETLNEKRWSLVLDTAQGAQKSLSQLKAGVTQLRQGAQALSTGAQQYSGAATQLATGVKQIGAGVTQMDAKLPNDADLAALKQGNQQLLTGQRELGKGLEQLQTGAKSLADGANQMREQTAGIPLVGDKISKGAAQLASGGTQLSDGLGKAREVSGKLASGGAQLADATGKLADGMSALGGGIRTLKSKLPEDSKLDAFSQGGQSLAQGSAKLLAGIELLDAAIPNGVNSPDGSARGLANSVEPEVEILAPVANNGTAFAPNMVSVALWVGAVMTAYLFNMRLILQAHATASGMAKALGKYSAPAVVVLIQALFAFLMLIFGLGVKAPHALSFLLTMMVASLVFLGMVFALLRMFGDVGKLLAVLLLTLQLAAGGGVMPIELSGDFFRAVHDWLPFTWVVKAFRASLFGAFDNGWVQAWLTVMIAGVVAFLLSSFLGRWKVVAEENYLPSIEV